MVPPCRRDARGRSTPGHRSWRRRWGNSVGSVTVISTAARAVTDVIDDECFSSPEGIATNPVNAQIYVVNRGADTVCVR